MPNMHNLILATILQTVFENTLMQHHVALPPGSMGKISYIAPAGQYNLQVSICYAFSATFSFVFA